MATREEAVEVLVQLANGQRRAIVQAKGAQALEPGDAVILVTSAGKVRITKAPKIIPINQANPVSQANQVNQVNPVNQ
jgi:outer membrane lipoprotein SlyB